ncbi:MAG: ribonuclease P protein component [Deltaproteobacteria bacterium]|nr:ribonuclease P protein component [Deltaproteobacteria bacterium]
MKEQSYRKTERITNKSRFKIIYNQGVWRSSRHFTTVTCVNTQGGKRLGITVTKKTGNAAIRNRIKRLIREFFRRNKGLFPDEHDVVIMAKRHMPPLTYRQACNELTELFTQEK